MKNIDRQIEWMETQIKHMERALPRGVESGHLSLEHATHKMECARSVLVTLTGTRAIIKGAEAHHG